MNDHKWSLAVKIRHRHCERSEAIHRREMDCFAALAMTGDGRISLSQAGGGLEAVGGDGLVPVS
ncbi:hypothetical protein [Sphingobium yanoikuyae]|uniref:hypothetical protein n=1 Tax=Sphingobium yanoikuyae TaxID=13690 RepID=UPI0013780BEE|nr:hypothetical protein [Sphingobium yanoikuyae]